MNAEIRVKQGVLDKLLGEMEEEKTALEEHLEYARKGYCSLNVYAGGETQAKRIRDILKPHHPVKVYSYSALFFSEV